MAGAENRRREDWIQSPLVEGLQDDITRLLLIGRLYLLRRQISGAGDGTVEIVRVRRPVERDIPSRLSPGSRHRRMGVNNAPDLGPGPVEPQMRCRIRRGAQLSLYLSSLKV